VTGMITEDQRGAIIDLFILQGILWSRTGRAAKLCQLVPDWQWGGDLGRLTRQQAGDLILALNAETRAPR